MSIFVIFILCQYPRVVWLVLVPRCTADYRQYSDHFTCSHRVSTSCNSHVMC